MPTSFPSGADANRCPLGGEVVEHLLRGTLWGARQASDNELACAGAMHRGVPITEPNAVNMD